MHDRILGAAFEAFTGEGYAETSTLDIAKRAKVSKRDLYANFGSKHAVLVACIKSRTERMQLLPDLPAPRNRQMLAATLTAFAMNLIRETTDASVIAAFRLAIAEASRAPEIAANSRRGRPRSCARYARPAFGECAVERAVGPGRSGGDGGAVFWTSLGGAAGRLAAGSRPSPRAGRGRASRRYSDDSLYAAASRPRHERLARSLTPRSPPLGTDRRHRRRKRSAVKVRAYHECTPKLTRSPVL